MDENMEYKELKKMDIPAMPENYQLAMAYVPFQKYERIMTPEEALKSGTVFPELADIPIYQNY